MNFLNQAQIIGNLTRDPEIREIPSGQSVCTCGVATKRRWKDKSGEYREDVEFHNVVCWGKLAEIVAEYAKKGTKVFFQGRLQTRTWDDDAGNKHYKTEIIAQDFIILSAKGDNASAEVAKPETAEKESAADDDDKTDEKKEKSTDKEEEISTDDLPF